MLFLGTVHYLLADDVSGDAFVDRLVLTYIRHGILVIHHLHDVKRLEIFPVIVIRLSVLDQALGPILILAILFMRHVDQSFLQIVHAIEGAILHAAYKIALFVFSGLEIQGPHDGLNARCVNRVDTLGALRRLEKSEQFLACRGATFHSLHGIDFLFILAIRIL